MSRHARIEEVSESDSDPDVMDISEFDPRSIISPVNMSKSHQLAPPPPNYQANAQSQSQSQTQSQPQSQGQGYNQGLEQMLQPQIRQQQSQDREKSKKWQCLYPIYFDAARSRTEGRRVGKEQAVPNPLARGIVDALCSLTDPRNIVFEPDRTHPKDWSNPGRVRIMLKGEGGKSVNPRIKNKHHLYTLVSEWLKANPTHPDDPKKLRIAGLPLPQDTPPGPAIPKGWKMNTILPLHSPAVTGGGVSENFLKDMMAEMQGEGAIAAASGSGGGSAGAIEEGNKKKKKDKKKGKA